jgi:hypothetical protein
MLADTLIASFLIPVSFYVVEKVSMRFGKKDREEDGTAQLLPASGD